MTIADIMQELRSQWIAHLVMGSVMTALLVYIATKK